MQQKKVLVLGTSFSAMPIIRELKKLDLSVTTLGAISEDPGSKFSDQHIDLDYSKVGEVLEFMENEFFDYVVPTCNDIAYFTAAALAEKFGYPGYETILTTTMLHTKKRFRILLKNNNLNQPQLFELEDILSKSDISIPLMIKPVDSFSGNGVSKITEINQIEAAVSNAKSYSKSGEYLIEEFLEGSLHSISLFIKDKKIQNYFVVDEFCTVYKYAVNNSNYPSRLPVELQDQIADSLGKLVSMQNLVDGLIHVQFIVNDGNYWVLELMRRCPGDLFGTLIENATGFSYYKNYVAPFIGSSCDAKRIPELIAFTGRHTVSQDFESFAESFSLQIQVPRVSFFPLKESGHKLFNAPGDKFGIAFVEFQSAQEMFEKTPILEMFFKVDSV